MTDTNRDLLHKLELAELERDSLRMEKKWLVISNDLLSKLVSLKEDKIERLKDEVETLHEVTMQLQENNINNEEVKIKIMSIQNLIDVIKEDMDNQRYIVLCREMLSLFELF